MVHRGGGGVSNNDIRVPTAQGKQGKWPHKKSGKHSELEILPKQGIWFAHVVNSLILKVTDISKFATKISPQKLKLVRDWSLITGRGGATKREGGHVRFYPYEKGGRGRKKF